jgi:hypothetical protein
MQEKTEMKRKLGKEPEGGSKKRKEVEMNHLWLPCFKSNRLPMTYRQHFLLIEQEVNVAGGECLKVFLLDIAQQMNAQGMAQLESKALFLSW